MSKIKKIVTVLIVFLMSMTNVFAAQEGTLYDVATELNENEIGMLGFDRASWWKTDPINNTNITYDVSGEEKNYTEMSPNEDYWIKYPNSLSYVGRKLTVIVHVTLLDKKGLTPRIMIVKDPNMTETVTQQIQTNSINSGSESGGESGGESDPTDDPEVVVDDGSQYNLVLVRWPKKPSKANNTLIKWSIEILDENGNPFKNNLIFGLLDPDESEYLFDTANRDIYYISAGVDGIYTSNVPFNKTFKVITQAQSGFSNPGIYPVVNNKIVENANFKEGKILTNFNYNSSFEFKTYTFDVGYLLVPYFYKIIKPFKITYILNGGENDPENPSEYNPSILMAEDRDIDIKDPKRDGYEFVGWKEGNKVYKTDTGDKTFTAVWKKIEYKIETEVVNGKITDSGNVDPGSNKKIEYSPNNGYILSKITVDGKEVDIKEFESSYEFKDIKENHKIRVEYVSAEPYKPADNPKTGPIAVLPIIILGAGAFIVYKKTKKKNIISKI